MLHNAPPAPCTAWLMMTGMQLHCEVCTKIFVTDRPIKESYIECTQTSETISHVAAARCRGNGGSHATVKTIWTVDTGTTWDIARPSDSTRLWVLTERQSNTKTKRKTQFLKTHLRYNYWWCFAKGDKDATPNFVFHSIANNYEQWNDLCTNITVILAYYKCLMSTWHRPASRPSGPSGHRSIAVNSGSQFVVFWIKKSATVIPMK